MGNERRARAAVLTAQGNARHAELNVLRDHHIQFNGSLLRSNLGSA